MVWHLANQLASRQNFRLCAVPSALIITLLSGLSQIFGSCGFGMLSASECEPGLTCQRNGKFHMNGKLQ
jgi:hypothetical protein